MKAFPYVREVPSDQEGYKAYAHEEGMDLRDYFAAKAMQGLLATVKDEDWEYDDVAFLSYGMADVMMKAREEK
jgi:hypothetical protein